MSLALTATLCIAVSVMSTIVPDTAHVAILSCQS
jgi:hypothetical protein